MGSICISNKERSYLRLIILGISGSGKSTFTKQMKYINSDGFDSQETLYYKQVIHRNIFIGLRELIQLAQREGIVFEEKNREHLEYIQSLDANIYDEPVTVDNRDMILSLWADKGMKKALNKSKYFQVQMTNMDYLIENIERISEDDYVPNVDDIIRARQRTTGTNNVTFEHRGYLWEIVDVGGQLPERGKWDKIINDGCAAIIFFAALDEYNTLSAEDAESTKMSISIQVWEEVIDAKHSNCAILFMNKTDVFKQKIKDKRHWKDFKKTFPEYTGKKNWTDCANHVKEFYLNFVPEEERNQIFVHLTCAIDTAKMETVFKDLSNFVFQQRLAVFGV